MCPPGGLQGVLQAAAATDDEITQPLATLQELSGRSVLPQAHSGFLIGAKALAQHVADQLEKCMRNNGPNDVLFTGHSAGAAVSSLLFHHFLSSASSKCEPPQFPKGS